VNKVLSAPCLRVPSNLPLLVNVEQREVVGLWHLKLLNLQMNISDQMRSVSE
jgi:hypothetical protein